MPLFVQLPDKKGAELWHTVESFEQAPEAKGSSQDFDRTFTTGCGLTQAAPAHRLAEADVPPWTHRHVAKGCFKTASDHQPKEG